MSIDLELKAQLLLELHAKQMYDKDMNRMGQYVLSDEPEDEPETGAEDESRFREGMYVVIDTVVGGGKGKITEINDEGTHAVVKLLDTSDSDMDEGDTVAVALEDVIEISDRDIKDLDDDLDFEESTDKFNSTLNDCFNNVNNR